MPERPLLSATQGTSLWAVTPEVILVRPTAVSVIISGFKKGRFDGNTNTSSTDGFVLKYNASGALQGTLNELATVDGNKDGIVDISQGHVESFYSYEIQEIITLEDPSGTDLSYCEATENPSPTDMPPAAEFPYGVFELQIDNVIADSVTMTLYLPVGSAPTTYYKYGPTPSDPTNHWYEFLYDGTTGAEITGDVITLHFVDGLRGDNDLLVNGTIVDPGGPVVPKTVTPDTPVDGGSLTDNVAQSGGGSGGGGGCFIESIF